jgi:hypothetical protein
VDFNTNDMKKYCLLAMLMFGFTLSSMAQIDCKYATSTKELLEQMSVKPLTNDVFYSHFNNKCNVTDEVRKRMLYHLDWRWSKDEIENYLERYFNEYKSYFRVDTLAKIASKGNDSLYKVSYDSIKKTIKTTAYSEINYGINNDIVYGVAYAYIKEAIPILQKAIKNPAYFNTNAVELALARFGDKKLQEKIIDKCKNKAEINGHEWLNEFLFGDAEKLLFISSQGSICKINEWMDTSKIMYYRQTDISKTKRYKAAMFIISILKRAINNVDFQKLTESFNYEAKDDVNNLLILNCKNWLLKNKGKYKINNFTGVGNPIDEL